MGKKKKAKLVSKTSQKQASLAEKTEQILLTMPKIIATQIGKDLIVQKQQATKLNLELKKWDLQKKKLAEKITGLKKKNTTAAKKQAKIAQKALQKTQKMLSFLNRSVDLVKKQIQVLTQKKAKYNALQAQLLSFQKDWVKKMSTATRAKKKKATNKSSLNSRALFPQESGVLEIIKNPAETESEFAEEESRETIS